MDAATPSRLFKRQTASEELRILNLLAKKHDCHKRKMKYHLAYAALYVLFATPILYVANASFRPVECPACEPCDRMHIPESKTNQFPKPDYALQSTGGKIVRVLTANTYIDSKRSDCDNWISDLYDRLTINHEEKAANILQPNTDPGNCWAFRGDNGAAVVKLFGRIYISGLTLEHTRVDISPTLEISSAPRKFTLTGLFSDDDERGFEFGNFEYDINGNPSQYFDVFRYSRSAFDLVKLNFTSNWGKKEYTCVYRIQIHGELLH